MQQIVATRGGAGQPAAMRIAVGRPDWTTLEGEWRTLEDESDCSFFQSWTWIGCQVRRRFDDPWLVRVTEDRRVAGLALFNRTGPPLARTLHLHETGHRARDSVFIEHNGPLVARGRHDLLRPILLAALRHGRLMLSGVADDILHVSRGLGSCRVVATRPAPFAALDHNGAEDWLAGLGASTRAHLRRSRRRYEATGALALTRAADGERARDFLDELESLHQTRWTTRGHAGAFGEPAFRAFHDALVERGLPRNEVDLLRVVSGSGSARATLGYLYNFRWRDRIYAYQGGFNYAAAGPHQAPGLTCHHVAIEDAIGRGARIYDFLGGAARYKTSLGSGEANLHWLELVRPYSPYALLSMARSLRNAFRSDVLMTN